MLTLTNTQLNTPSNRTIAFPSQVFPDDIYYYITGLADSYNIEEAAIAGSLLGVFNALTNGRIKVRTPGGWDMFCNFYVLIGIKNFTQQSLLFKTHVDIIKQAEHTTSDFCHDWQSYNIDEYLQKPTDNYYLPYGVKSIITQHNDLHMLFKTHGEILIQSAHDSFVHQKNHPALFEACLSGLLFTSSQDIVSLLHAKLTKTNIIRRYCLYVVDSDSHDSLHQMTPMDSAYTTPYIELIHQLLDRYRNRSAYIASTQGESSYTEPFLFTLNNDAKALWVLFCTELVDYTCSGQPLSGYKDWCDYLKLVTLRLAGTLHALRTDALDTHIGEETMQHAIDIVDFFIAHALRARSTVCENQSDLDCVAHDVKALISRYYPNETRITRTQLTEITRNKHYGRKHMLDKVVRYMEDTGLISEIRIEKDPETKRKICYYML